MTAKELHRFGVIDDIIPEPLGGYAHRDQQLRMAKHAQDLPAAATCAN